MCGRPHFAMTVADFTRRTQCAHSSAGGQGRARSSGPAPGPCGHAVLLFKVVTGVPPAELFIETQPELTSHEHAYPGDAVLH